MVQVFGVATEDMDALTFGTPRLIRNLMAPASAKVTVTEYDYDKVGTSCMLAAHPFESVRGPQAG